MTITLDQYFELPGDAVRSNALELLSRVNAMLADIQVPPALMPVVNSGWRSPRHNKAAGGADNSRHMSGEAIDIADPSGVLDEYLMRHPQHLIDHDLYMEHPSCTKGWCHLQSSRPASGNRVFFP